MHCQVMAPKRQSAIKTSVTPLRKQPKRLSHAGIEITIFRVGIQSVNCESLYKTFLQSPQEDDSSLAATALRVKLDKKRRDLWPRQFGALTSHSLVEKHGVF